MDTAVKPNSVRGLTVPERGVRRRFVGFSTSLERGLWLGLLTLFIVAVAVESYHDGVLSDQIRTAFLFLFAGVVASLSAVDTRRSRAARAVKFTLQVLAAAGVIWAVVWLVPGSLMMVGLPHVAVRFVVYLGLAPLVFWAWGTWVWFYAEVWLLRGVPAEGDAAPRSQQPGRRATARLWELLRRVPVASFPGTFAPVGKLCLAAVQRDKHDFVKAWRELCALWGPTVLNFGRFINAIIEEGVIREIGLALLDPLFLYPAKIRANRLDRMMRITGHRIADGAHPIDSAEYDERRLSALKTLLVALTLLFMFGGMLELQGCRRRTPRGVLYGKGSRIAKGKVPILRKKREKQKKKSEKKKKTQQQINRESMLKLFKEDMNELSKASTLSEASISADAGLPDGEGKGDTAAGSPKGTVIGGNYYFFRVKYRGGNWDANRKGIPALMKEVTKAISVKTNPKDQYVTLRGLPRHSGEFFPVLLYITGNGNISVSDREVQNLRKYLESGGFLFADCSGGSFWGSFRQLMQNKVFPGKRFRRISYDHTIFRGDYMPWLMRRGCPVYRQHDGAGDARGIFLGSRLAVFYSGGDLGAAWASVGWSKAKRKHVELAFRMGVNIIAYAMIYGGEKGLVDEATE